MRFTTFAVALVLAAALIAATPTPQRQGAPDFDAEAFADVAEADAAEDAAAVEDAAIEQAVSEADADTATLVRRGLDDARSYGGRDIYGGPHAGPHVPIVHGAAPVHHDDASYGRGSNYRGPHAPVVHDTVRPVSHGNGGVAGVHQDAVTPFGVPPLHRNPVGAIADVPAVHGPVVDPILAVHNAVTGVAATIANSVVGGSIFLPGETFALRNPDKGTCLAATVSRVTGRWRLVTERCDMHGVQPLHRTFHWRPTAEPGQFHLATVLHGELMCALHEKTGTRFYPCNPQSTVYSRGPTTKHGTFQIRDVGRGSRCMDAEFHSALRMKPCSQRFDDQGWRKVHVGMLHLGGAVRP